MKLEEALRKTKPRQITIEEVLSLQKSACWAGSNEEVNEIKAWNSALVAVVKMLEGKK